MVGLTYFNCGELAEAKKHCQSAYEAAREIKSDHFLADAAMMLGVIHGADGNKEIAKKYFEEARSLAEPIHLTRVMNVTNREIEKLLSEA
jgi:TolA-binding protein